MLPNFENYLNKVYPITKGKFRIPLSITEFSIEKEKLKEINKDLKLIIENIKDIIFQVYEGEITYDFGPFKEFYLNLFDNLNKKDIKNLLDKGYVRFDLVFNKEKDPKLLEINSDFPDGVIMIDITSEYISKVMSFKGRIGNNSTHFKNLFKKNIKYIVYNDERVFIDEFYLESKLINGIVKKEGDFNEDNSDDFEIMRGLEIYRSKKPNYYFMFNQYNLINNMIFLLLGNKLNLALLFDLEIYSKNDKPNILPYTTQEYSKIKGKFVAKKLFSCGGEGVVFNKRIENAIYQEYIEIDKRKIEYLDVNNKIKKDEFYYSFDPYIFFSNNIYNGNILMRFSKDKKLNVEAGGGVGFWTII